MFEISMMPDFPYKNASGTLSLGVEEIALCCLLYKLLPTQVLISLYISVRYFFYQRLSGFSYNLTIVSKPMQRKFRSISCFLFRECKPWYSSVLGLHA